MLTDAEITTQFPFLDPPSLATDDPETVTGVVPYLQQQRLLDWIKASNVYSPSIHTNIASTVAAQTGVAAAKLLAYLAKLQETVKAGVPLTIRIPAGRQSENINFERDRERFITYILRLMYGKSGGSGIPFIGMEGYVPNQSVDDEE